jgi:hypothetical protein
MISDERPITGVAIGTENEQFFQSDHQLKEQKRKSFKRTLLKEAGTPVQWSSKILSMCLGSRRSDSGKVLFVGESGFLAKRVQLPVRKWSWNYLEISIIFSNQIGSIYAEIREYQLY